MYSIPGIIVIVILAFLGGVATGINAVPPVYVDCNNGPDGYACCGDEE